MNTLQDSPTPHRRHSGQIRIRIQPEERQAYEKWRSQEWQEGHSHAETLSSWIRHQLKPILHPPQNLAFCPIPHELYKTSAQLARGLGMTPDAFIEVCINAISDMADQPKPSLPAIVKAVRNLRADNRAS